MTAFLTDVTDYTNLVYHSEIGFVHYIKRHSAKLALVVDGKPKSLDLGTGRFTSDVMFFKTKRVSFYVIELGCGTLLKFADKDTEYLDDGRHCVPLELTEIVDRVPARAECKLEAFRF